MGLFKKKKKEVEAPVAVKTETVALAKGVEDEVHAAIAAALFELNQNVHDEEYSFLTFSDEDTRYSPWSSKLFAMTRLPRK